MEKRDDGRKVGIPIREGAALRFIQEHPHSVHCHGDVQQGKSLTSQGDTVE